MSPSGDKPWTTPTAKYNRKLSDQGSPGPGPSATESHSGDSLRSPREEMFVDARVTILKQQLREAQFSLQEKQRNLDKVLHDLYVVTHMPPAKDTRLQEVESAQKTLETTIEGLLTEKQGLLDQIQDLAKNEATLAAEKTQSIQQLETVYRQKLNTAARSAVAQQQNYDSKIQNLEEINRQLKYQFQTLDVNSEQARLESKAEIEDLNVRIQELEGRNQQQLSESDRLRDMLHDAQTALREAKAKIAEMEAESEIQTTTLGSIMDYNKDLCEKLESLRLKAEATNRVADTQLVKETSPKIIDTEQWVRQYKLERGMDPDEEDSEFDFFSRESDPDQAGNSGNKTSKDPPRELPAQTSQHATGTTSESGTVIFNEAIINPSTETDVFTNGGSGDRVIPQGIPDMESLHLTKERPGSESDSESSVWDDKPKGATLAEGFRASVSEMSGGNLSSTLPSPEQKGVGASLHDATGSMSEPSVNITTEETAQPEEEVLVGLCNPSQRNKVQLDTAVSKVGNDGLNDEEYETKAKSVSASSSVSQNGGYVPFETGELPEMFNEIREVRVYDVPEGTLLKDVLAQINCGTIEKVSWDPRDRTTLSVVFVEHKQALQQYTKWLNHGFWIPLIPNTNNQCSNSPFDHWHQCSVKFEWTSNSQPMPSELKDAVNLRGVTRVLVVSGPVYRFPTDKIEQDITKVIKHPPEDVFEIIVVNHETKEVIVRFSAIIYCVKVMKKLQDHPDWKNINFNYGADPCDQGAFSNDVLYRKNEPSTPPKSSAAREPGITLPPSMKSYTDTKQETDIANILTSDGSAMTPGFIQEILAAGLVSKKALRAKGLLLPKTGDRWEMQNDPSIAPRGPDNWSSKEQKAIDVYRAELQMLHALKKAEKSAKEVLSPVAVLPFEHYETRIVSLSGLPEDVSYREFCPFVKGGPVDTIQLDSQEGTAIVVFLRAGDAERFKQYVRMRDLYINGHKLGLDKFPTRLSNMRLWNPAKVLSDGLSRCLFLEGLPNGSTPESVMGDISGLCSSGLRVEYENIQVEGVCGKISTTAISMAYFIRENLNLHPKYTGLRVNYVRDTCAQTADPVLAL